MKLHPCAACKICHARQLDLHPAQPRRQSWFAPNATLGLNASLGYTGSFETGDTRSGNLGVTSVGPYKLADVWRADLGVSLRVQF